MSRAYQDASLDYGYETETLSLMSYLTARAMMYLFKKDYTNLYNVIDVLYISTKTKISKDLPDNFEKDLVSLNERLYSEAPKNAQVKSKLFEDTRELWAGMASALTKSNLMFRAKIDPSELVTQ